MHWKRWRRSVEDLPDSLVREGALTVRDTAERFGVSVFTVGNWQGPDGCHTLTVTRPGDRGGGQLPWRDSIV